MLNASQTVDRYILQMRERCLSLAADLDRVNRAGGLAGDPRLQKLHAALAVLTDADAAKAQRVQMIFSDKSPGPHGSAK